MHYYKFNIGDFDKITRHLSILERGLFRDLLDLYIKNEKPIIADFKKLSRLLCVKSKAEQQALNNVLEDFFVLGEDGYYSEFCHDILTDTLKRTETSAENGKKGGRPSKEKQSQEKASISLDESENKPNENLEKTQQKPSENLKENYPTTHKPITQTPINPSTTISKPQANVPAGYVLYKTDDDNEYSLFDLEQVYDNVYADFIEQAKASYVTIVLSEQQYKEMFDKMRQWSLEKKDTRTPQKWMNTWLSWVNNNAYKFNNPKTTHAKTATATTSYDSKNVNKAWDSVPKVEYTAEQIAQFRAESDAISKELNLI